MNKYTIGTQHKMASDSVIYHENAATYEIFSQAEDMPGHIANYLVNELRDMTVLDVGCGTGKYINILAQAVKQYIGLDCSTEQLDIAKMKTTQFSNTSLIKGLAEQIGIRSYSIDAAVSAWVLESIRNNRIQNKILLEMDRVLRKQGAFYVIENGGESQFEDIIRRKPDISTTRENRAWLLHKGFEQIKAVESYFLFPSVEEAKEVFSAIWGDEIADRIKDRKINHNINIYKKVKL